MSEDIVKRIQRLNTEQAIALSEKEKAEKNIKEIMQKLSSLDIHSNKELSSEIKILEDKLKLKEKELEKNVSKIESELKARKN